MDNTDDIASATATAARCLRMRRVKARGASLPRLETARHASQSHGRAQYARHSLPLGASGTWGGIGKIGLGNDEIILIYLKYLRKLLNPM